MGYGRLPKRCKDTLAYRDVNIRMAKLLGSNVAAQYECGKYKGE